MTKTSAVRCILRRCRGSPARIITGTGQIIEFRHDKGCMRDTIQIYIHGTLRQCIRIDHQTVRSLRDINAVIFQDQAIVLPFSGILRSRHFIYILP